MIGELVCPDCGGVVGATEVTEAGPPCTCFTRRSPAMSGTLSGTVVDGVDATGDDVFDAAPAPPVVLKVCRLCGKDLNGHRRVREHGGQSYLCVACAKEDEKREHYGRVRCRVCGKLTLEEKLTDYEGTMMCPHCHEQRTLMRRQEIKRIGFSGASTREELRHVYILLMIAAGLTVVILIGVLVNHYR